MASPAFETLFVGAYNRLAVAAARACAERPGTLYNPLFLHGPAGLGKTRLLQTLRDGALDGDHAPCLLSADAFATRVAACVEKEGPSKLDSLFAEYDLLLIDDLDALAEKETAQDVLLSMIDRWCEAQRQLAFTALHPPRELSGFSSRLVSRLQWGLVVAVDSLDAESREALLAERADALELHLPASVLHFLASNTFTTLRQLDGLVHKLHSRVALLGHRVDMDLAMALARDYAPSAVPTLTLQRIREEISSYFSISEEDLLSRSRARSLAFPRQVGMYLSHRLTKASLEEIGRAYGGRDHSTVNHGCQKIRQLTLTDNELRHTLEELEQRMSVSCS